MCEQQVGSVCQAWGLAQRNGSRIWLSIEMFVEFVESAGARALAPGGAGWASGLLTHPRSSCEARLALEGTSGEALGQPQGMFPSMPEGDLILGPTFRLTAASAPPTPRPPPPGCGA